VEFLVLGPFEVRSEGRPVSIRSPKQRALLAALLLHANEVVASDRLIDELWAERPPGSAANVLQVYVSQLRKLLPGPIVTQSPGYVLQADPVRIDSVRFEMLLEEGMRVLAAGEPERALAILQDATALWRGAAFSDFAFADFARSESARLDELRLLAVEERFEASLALGLHAAVVPELEALAAEHPLRERLSGQLMLALYRSGRQAEALDAYSRARKRLVDELGIEPGPALQRLEKSILNQDRDLDLSDAAPRAAPPAPAAPAPAEPAAPVARKTVTVLFAEWALESVRSEAIDPETLEPVLDRLVESLAGAVERHGGSIQWSREAEAIAAFGLPLVHEDDALRAVRAAADLRAAVAAAGADLERDFGVRAGVRIGVNTGQILTGVAFASPSIGGASSVAARVGREADAGAIHIADATRELVRDAIEAEPAPREGSWRVLDVRAGTLGVSRRLDAPTVGRGRELEALARALESAEHERIAALVTVVGPPGIGKSHLAGAFAASLGDRARVLVGHCVAYGEGNAFAPVAEVVRRFGGEEPLAAIRELLAGDEEGEVICDRIAAVIGLSDAGGGPETTFWAVRKLLEALARDRPLILVLDDLHWAEPTLLDLVEYVLDWTFEAPVLLVGLSRPELLDDRPAWAGGKRNVSSLALGPLTDEEARALVDGLPDAAGLDAERRDRIAEAAAGNPLFIEQMVAMRAAENGSGAELAIPPTIHALLAARLDRLAPDERSVLERASVMGREFWREALAELLPHGAPGEALRDLVRKQLIEPTRSSLLPADALRFQSILIRDAVYESVPKRARATLHEQVARWLERAVEGQGSAARYDEVLGFHLEQTFAYAKELGPVDEHAAAVGREAAGYLAAAGRRAFAQGDMSGAAALLRRAAALLPEGDPARLALLPTAGEACHETGDFDGARAILDEAIAGAETRGDASLRAKARLVRALVEATTGDEELREPFVAEAEGAVGLFEQAGDDEGLATAFRMLAWAHGTAGRYGDAAAAAERAVERAGRAGDERQRARAASQYALAALHGPTPATEAIERCRRIVEEVAGDRRSEGLVTSILGWLEAMRGDFELARSLAGRARAILVDLGTSVLAASTSQESCQIELLAGDPAAAERDLRRDYEALTVLGEKYLLSTVAGDLAQAVYLQGRHDEALELSRVAEDLAADDDVTSQAFWRSVRAKVLARRGEPDEALALGESAVELLRETDDLVALARVLTDLAEVQAADHRVSEARASLEEAAELLERKENPVGAKRAREALDGLAAGYFM
jgi:DNA-binding SARP family transcriptional activator/predicted ATPase